LEYNSKGVIFIYKIMDILDMIIVGYIIYVICLVIAIFNADHLD
jgi:uncharacterized integral membrane protein